MKNMTPKDFFVHVGTMVALYVSSISLITLLFQIINVAFPDSLYSFYDPYSSGIRWAVASLTIIFPLYIFLSWFLEREYKVMPEKLELGIRRWLTFLTLFVAGIAVTIDLIVLINSFLGGEVTARFGLKVLAVFVVAGLVFAYYLWDLRKNTATSTQIPKIFAGVSVIVVIGSIVSGFIVMGSPQTQRLMRYDNQKTSDLQNIQWQIINYWQQKQTLPENLTALADPISNFTTPVDLQSNEMYEYRKVSDLSFELCADFNLESRDFARSSGKSSLGYPAPYGFDESSINWQHGPDRTCFTRTIDPKLYPPVKN